MISTITFYELSNGYLTYICEKIGIKKIPKSKYEKVNKLNTILKNDKFILGYFDLKYKKISYFFNKDSEKNNISVKYIKDIKENNEEANKDEINVEETNKEIKEETNVEETNKEIKEEINVEETNVEELNKEIKEETNEEIKEEINVKEPNKEIKEETNVEETKVEETNFEETNIEEDKIIYYEKYNNGYFVPYESRNRDRLPECGKNWNTFDSISVLLGGLYRNSDEMPNNKNGWLFSCSAQSYLNENMQEKKDHILKNLSFNKGIVYSNDLNLYKYIPILQLKTCDKIYQGIYIEKLKGWDFSNYHEEQIAKMIK